MKEYAGRVLEGNVTITTDGSLNFHQSKAACTKSRPVKYAHSKLNISKKGIITSGAGKHVPAADIFSDNQL